MLERKNEERIGLLLSGGGARAAYQVGVLGAIAKLMPKNAKNPFHIISGTSAGAFNAASLGSHAHRLRTGVRLLEYVWKNISSEQIYTPQSGNMLGSASAMLLSSMRSKPADVPRSLLDNSPLASLLNRVLKLHKIQRNIDRGLLDALSITASAYSTGESVSFYQGVKGLKDWEGPPSNWTTESDYPFPSAGLSGAAGLVPSGENRKPVLSVMAPSASWPQPQHRFIWGPRDCLPWGSAEIATKAPLENKMTEAPSSVADYWAYAQQRLRRYFR